MQSAVRAIGTGIQRADVCAEWSGQMDARMVLSSAASRWPTGQTPAEATRCGSRRMGRASTMTGVKPPRNAPRQNGWDSGPCRGSREVGRSHVPSDDVTRRRRRLRHAVTATANRPPQFQEVSISNQLSNDNGHITEFPCARRRSAPSFTCNDFLRPGITPRSKLRVPLLPRHPTDPPSTTQRAKSPT